MRKFFTAVILAVFMFSAQIAAAYDYDWNKAPRFGNKAEFARYVENGRRRGQTVFHVVITNDSILPTAWRTRNINKNDFADIVPCRDYVPLHTYMEDRVIQMAFRVIEYPGTNVANAYLSRNKEQAWMSLTNEEQKLYNIAVGIVDEAKKYSSEREKARYIHDVICDKVLEYKNENERNKTAIGALIDGYAQCQGYSDAFYMLGRVAGLNVRRIGGKFGDGYHVWNTITLSDGKTYCVDVTMDDGYNSHEWFLANFEVMKRHHSCDWSVITNLQ